MVETNKFAFDLEGTLVNLEPWHQLAFEEVAKGLEVVFASQEFNKFVGAGDKAISEEIARLARSTGGLISPVEVRGLKNAIHRDLLYSNVIFPRSGVPEYLDRAKFVGGDLVITSLTPARDAEHILRKAGLKPFFRHTLVESDVRFLKPDPEVYLRSAELLSISPKHQLVHEDSPTGVRAAKAAGSPVIAFPVHDNLEFNPEPDAVFFSWVGLDPNELYCRLIEQAQP